MAFVAQNELLVWRASCITAWASYSAALVVNGYRECKNIALIDFAVRDFSESEDVDLELRV
jgi:hypothetical protein